MKKIIKKIFLALLIVFLLMQFFPRPEKNSITSNKDDIFLSHPASAQVQQIIKSSCYDCHSNNTSYPWYAYIQPVSYWLGAHIKDGKKELNFSQYGTYTVRKQARKLKEIISQVKQDEMPLTSYTLIHWDARLDPDQKQALLVWATSEFDKVKDSLPK